MNPQDELQALIDLFPQERALIERAEHIPPALTPEPYKQMLVHEHHSVYVPAPRIEAVDTTAAGDAFVGALAAALQAGGAAADALRRAVYAGSLACTRMGAIPSLPTAEQVAEALGLEASRH